jgi:negative regulator of flagellin synthesis FlgM
MDISNNLEGLKSLLGTQVATPAATQQVKGGTAATTSALGGDQATVSSAGNGVSQMAGDSDVRTDKVSTVQAALATGSYDVSASLVATKVVDSMLDEQS